jgi:hypothetical protein
MLMSGMCAHVSGSSCWCAMMGRLPTADAWGRGWRFRPCKVVHMV